MSDNQVILKKSTKLYDGYVYMIQSADMSRDVCKIGRGKSIKRVLSYGLDTKVHHCSYVENMVYIENILKNEFKRIFLLKRGTEYFEGNLNEMRDKFIEVIKKYNKLGNIVSNECDNSEELLDIFIKFPEYATDISFGGSKKLIQFSNCEDARFQVIEITDEKELNIIEIMPECMEGQCDCKICDEVLDCKVCLKSLTSWRIKNMLDTQRLIVDRTYDIYKILNKLYANVTNINVVGIDDNPYNIKYDRDTSLRSIMRSNIIVNDKWLFVNVSMKQVIGVDRHELLFPEEAYFMMPEANKRISSISITICKLGESYYCCNYLREYFPYCIEMNDNTNKYYTMNRNYEYIGTGKKSLPGLKYGEWRRIYLFNDGNPPWLGTSQNAISIANRLFKLTEKYKWEESSPKTELLVKTLAEN